ncbi:MAG: hypothetical protein ACE14O_01660 [Candidatus Cloacimonadaceae bacterium]
MIVKIPFKDADFISVELPLTLPTGSERVKNRTSLDIIGVPVATRKQIFQAGDY